MIELHQVRRLPACKTIVALYAFGRVPRTTFYALVCEFLDASGVSVANYPDDDGIYVERWKESGWHDQTRLVRCGPTDPAGSVVTGIDLKKWTRGRSLVQWSKQL